MVRSGDKAFFRRWILVRFGHSFYGSEQEDISLIDKLTIPQELSGLANLAIEGLKRILKQKGFSYKKTVDEIEAEYTTYSSSAHSFITSHLIPSDKDTSKIVLYEMYSVWAHSKGLSPVPANKFGGAVKKSGYKDYRLRSPDEKRNRPYMWSELEVDEDVAELYRKHLEEKEKMDNT